MTDILVAITVDPKAPPARKRFFERYCRSSVWLAAESAGLVGAQVRIYDGPEHVCLKRQRALDEARAENFRWVFEADNDIVLAQDALMTLRIAAQERSAAVAYSDYTGICLPGNAHKKGPVFVQQSAPWNAAVLRKRNLVSTMSLFDVEQLASFGVRWDPGLERFQDWDIALQLAKAKLIGAYVPESLFFAFYVTPGITSRVPHESAIAALRAKHPELGR